ncbi:MAG: adenylate/guanylate cyclase domain-containing protein [Nitrosopumilus sp.]|nr:MAG: adenylate/guanylate cyclase domain-containing protein [Nitrosopumilus sp.]
MSIALSVFKNRLVIPSLISFSLDKKLILFVMMVSIFALSIASLLSFNYAEEILKQRVGNQLLSESSIRGNSIENLFETRIKDLQNLSTDPIIQNLVDELNQRKLNTGYDARIEEKRNQFLISVQTFQESVGYSIGVEDIKIIGTKGMSFFSLDRLKNNDFSQDPRFLKGLQEPFVGFEPVDNFGKKMVVAIPIFPSSGQKSSEPIGVIISTMRSAEIDKILLNRSGLGETGEIYLVNEDFLMISESRFMENVVFNQKVETLGTIQCFENGEEIQGLYQDYRGIWTFGSTYCLKDARLVLLAEIDERETMEPVLILQDEIIQTGIVITLAMGVIAFFLAKSISRPLIKLKNAANEISHGNFGVRTELKSRDEVGQLSSAFDLMAKKLQYSLVTIKQKEELIKRQQDVLLQFSNFSENYCVCFIDIIDSTRIMAKLSDLNTSKFYSIFLNLMNEIVSNFDGVVVKNIGDSLLFYFPKTNSQDEQSLKQAIDCCLEMSESNKIVNKMRNKEGLPSVDYRISATYGPVRVAKIATSSVDDIFGSTVNKCSKINYAAPPNGVVIGDELCMLVKSIEGYNFSRITNNPIVNERGYTVYQVSSKKKTLQKLIDPQPSPKKHESKRERNLP